MRLRFTKSYKPKADLNDKQAVNDEVIEYFNELRLFEHGIKLSE